MLHVCLRRITTVWKKFGVRHEFLLQIPKTIDDSVSMSTSSTVHGVYFVYTVHICIFLSTWIHLLFISAMFYCLFHIVCMLILRVKAKKKLWLVNNVCYDFNTSNTYIRNPQRNPYNQLLYSLKTFDHFSWLVVKQMTNFMRCKWNVLTMTMIANHSNWRWSGLTKVNFPFYLVMLQIWCTLAAYEQFTCICNACESKLILISLHRMQSIHI